MHEELRELKVELGRVHREIHGLHQKLDALSILVITPADEAAMRHSLRRMRRTVRRAKALDKLTP